MKINKKIKSACKNRVESVQFICARLKSIISQPCDITQFNWILIAFCDITQFIVSFLASCASNTHASCCYCCCCVPWRQRRHAAAVGGARMHALWESTHAPVLEKQHALTQARRPGSLNRPQNKRPRPWKRQRRCKCRSGSTAAKLSPNEVAIMMMMINGRTF